MTNNRIALSVFSVLLLVLTTGSRSSDDSLVFSVLHHDVRLKEMIRFLMPIKYTDIAGDSVARPETAKIASSLWETEKCTRLPLSVYGKLCAAVAETFEKGGMYGTQRSKECCAYLNEQFAVNKRNALASMKGDAQVFEADILLMLRIASGGKPETLPSDLHVLYKQMCEPQEAPMLPYAGRWCKMGSSSLKMESYYKTFKPEPIFSRTFKIDETISKKDDDWQYNTKPAKTKPIKSRRAD